MERFSFFFLSRYGSQREETVKEFGTFLIKEEELGTRSKVTEKNMLEHNSD